MNSILGNKNSKLLLLNEIDDSKLTKIILSFIIIITPLQVSEIPVLNSRILTLVLSIFLFVINLNTILNFKRKLSTNYSLPVLLFIISMFISVLVGPPYKYMDQVFESLSYNTTEIYAVIDIFKVAVVQLIIIFIIYVTINTVQDIIFYLKSFIVSSFLINVFGIIALATQNISDRLRGIISDPNYLGRFEVFIILILLGYLVFFKKDSFKSFFIILYMIFCFVMLFLTLSRGALVTCFLSAFIMFLFSKKKIVRVLIIVFSILIIPLLFALIGTYRIGAGASGGLVGTFADVSNSTRLAINIAAWNMFVDYPIFGVGYWNFYNMYINHMYVPEGIPVFLKVAVVHSWFFNTIAEQGLLGILSIFWIIFIIFRDNLKALRNKTLKYEVKGIGVILFCMFFVIIFFGINFPTFVPEISFAVTAGLIGAYIKITQIT